MQTSKKLSVAIAGLGFGEKVHLHALKDSELMSPIALWHPSPERVDKAANKHNLKGYTDWGKLLSDLEINAIIIATPPEPRYGLAKDALIAGKHLLLEKPISINREQALNLERISVKNNLTVAVDFEYRAVPHFIQAKRILDQGGIGTPWLVKFDWLMNSRADINRPWNWYSQKEKGGGVIGALGTHAIDIMHWLIGPTVSVRSLLSTSIKERPIPNTGLCKEVTSEDVCLAQLHLKSAYNNNVPAQLTLSSVSNQGRGCWIEIYGSKGTLIIGSDNQKDYVHGFELWLAKSNEKSKSLITPDEDICFAKTWEDGRIAPVNRIHNWWAESIKNRTPVIPGILEGVESQTVCDKIIESNSSGIKIQIN